MQAVLKREISSECCHSGTCIIHIFFVQKHGLMCCSFKKNIKIFGTSFKALLMMRLYETLLTWVSKAISKANESTDATHSWNSGWMWSSAPAFRSSNSSFLLMTELWVVSRLLQIVVFSLTSAGITRTPVWFHFNYFRSSNRKICYLKYAKYFFSSLLQVTDLPHFKY